MQNQVSKPTRTIKVCHLREKLFILNHCKNAFNKSLVENQKSYKNVKQENYKTYTK